MIVRTQSSESGWKARHAALKAERENPPAGPIDDFQGDDAHLVACILAILELDEEGCLIPNGLGGHARRLLSAAACRLGRV